ncbi:translin-associated protein X [Culicoides brevitarsis]|uniref:translin-associated protein X n=1 Tax=Culicoides brevitarsis TaxID=469753 RepID=UPI00307C993B
MIRYQHNNTVLELFSKIAQEIDQKNDRNERLIKLSRDITIQSKKIIFLLQTTSKNNKENVLEEAKQKIDKLATINFQAVAKELKDRDQYQYLRAFTFGLQEYIEACSFYDYLNGDPICDWNDFQNKLTFDAEGTHVFVSPTDLLLGLSDLTGEVMRFCINSLGSSNVEECFTSTKFMQIIHKCLLSTTLQSRDFCHKLLTLKQSVLKCEMVCFLIKVRGSEATKLGAEGIYTNIVETRKDEDEGFY